MIHTTINLGKAALVAGVKALQKLAAAKASKQAVTEVLKNTDLLSAGIAAGRIEAGERKKEEVKAEPTVAEASTPAPEAPKSESTPEVSVSEAPVQEVVAEEAATASPVPTPEPPAAETPAPEPAPSIAEAAGLPPITLTRILPEGDNDEGKGWQCSKYAWYLATGVRMNHAPHPDYGPCHGADMVDHLITHLGWRECGKKNGAIFSYADSEDGHTGVVVDAANNIVSDANTVARPLCVDRQQLDLDVLGARYAEE